MGSKINSNGTVAKCTQRKAAAEQYVTKSGTIQVHSQQYTQQQVEDLYEACIDARKNLVNLRGQVAAALTARQQADATMNAFDVGLRAWVDTTYGPKSQAAVDFGFSRKQPAKPKVAVKAEAQAKAKATRKVRGITGPKARKKLTATTPATTVAAPEPVTPAPKA
jgi:hypothetical protein